MCDIDLGEADHCIFKMIECYMDKYGTYALRDFHCVDFSQSNFIRHGIKVKNFVSSFLRNKFFLNKVRRKHSKGKR